jgi:hypothetical protein
VSGAEDQESLPSPAQVKAATEVARLASGDPRAAIEMMEELAREYEQVRISMPSGQERTRRRTDIVGRMTVVALGAETLLPRLSASAQPGDRLAAVVILKLRFNLKTAVSRRRTRDFEARGGLESAGWQRGRA